MLITFKIALRYIFSKYYKNLINLITTIAIFSLVIGTISLTIVMSAFNGLDDLIKNLYESFDPDIKIMPNKGKTFFLSDIPLESIKNIQGVEAILPSIDETAYVKYENNETIVRIKGVEHDFCKSVPFEKTIVEGKYLLQESEMPFTVIGYQIAAKLGVYIADFPKKIDIYAARRNGKINTMNPETFFQSKSVYPSGVFAINQDFDAKYMLTSIAFARELFDFSTNELSYLEIKVKSGYSKAAVKQQIYSIIKNENFTIKTREELNEVVFKTNKTEKWITYFILLFVLIICLFNLMGAITMILLDKKKDIYTLYSMGLSVKKIKQVFSFTGIAITCIGTITGLMLGIAICYAQSKFNLVTIQQGIVEAYPVKVKWQDIVLIFSTVTIIGYFAGLIPVNLLINKKSIYAKN